MEFILRRTRKRRLDYQQIEGRLQRRWMYDSVAKYPIPHAISVISKHTEQHPPCQTPNNLVYPSSSAGICPNAVCPVSSACLMASFSPTNPFPHCSQTILNVAVSTLYPLAFNFCAMVCDAPRTSS